MKAPSIGILGAGLYLPANIRTNAYWSDHVTRGWKERAARRMGRMRDVLAEDKSELGKMVHDSMVSLADDPFQGARERRVIADDMKASDMETLAARDAIARANIPLSEIDAVLSHQICPDFINVPSAAVVHGNLGLKERAQCVMIDAACNSFINQLVMAQGLILAGRARYVLCTQSSALTRFPESGEVIDSWNGDAGSAVIVGQVKDGNGILGTSFHTNGKMWGTLVCGIPGDRWQNGRCSIYSEDPKANLDWVINLPRRAGDTVREALADAKLTEQDVAFYASHQGFKWLHPVTQHAAGLTHAKSVDHFHITAAISSVNLPFQLAVGEKEGLLREGDVVACFQGGTGMTWASMALRWGA
jgi:3-oxoacyl-[acyl-carrier-protein] synthase III